jgi:hypothetical protein
MQSKEVKQMVLSNKFSSFLHISYSFLFLSCKLNAQELPPIQLDRPDQTECPFITPKKFIQIENGFNIENVNSNQTNYSYPTSLWKYGINEKFELRLITEIVSSKIDSLTISGFTPIAIGFKTALIEEKGFIPKTSFIGHITTSSIGSSKFHTKYITPSFRFTMQHTLSDKIVLAYNLGAEWNGESAEQTYIYTMTTGVALTKKLGFYFELYGYLPYDNSIDNRADGGFTYLLNNDLIIDISGGIGLSDISPINYCSLGLSYRFKLLK